MAKHSNCRKICELIDQHTGKDQENSSQKLITFVKDRLGHDRRYAIDASKIEKELGWIPQHSFEQGITETVAWYLKNQNWTKRIIEGDYQNYYAKQYQSFGCK